MRRPAATLGLALLLAGCASSGAFRAGQKAERNDDYNRAVLEYSRAAKLSPDNLTYRKSLERARLRAAQEHTLLARRLLARGLLKDALEELRLAADLSPDAKLRDEIVALEARLRAGADQAAANLDDVKSRSRESAFPGLVLDAAARAPLGLTFHDASLRETYLALGKTVGVNFVFDPQFQDTTIDLDLRDVPFEQALTALGNVGRTFHRVMDSKVVTVVPDTQTKRREYEQQVVKTFYLSNADLRETIDLLRVVLGARRVASLPGSNAITINDAPERVAAAERIIDMVDKKRAEVVVDVEILEVNRNRLREYGLQILSISPEDGRVGPGIVGALFPRQTALGADGGPTLDENPYQKGNIFLSGLPGVVYRLLKTDNSTRLLANPQLRTTELQTAQARFGDQVPVPVTTFVPIAQGTISQQPVTSFQYKDVGVNIDITPRVHHDGDVTLAVKLDVSSLAPSVGVAGVQGLPTFNSRTLTSQIRLHDGETSVLAGLIRSDEREQIAGIPGLSDLPILGKVFSRNQREAIESDIIMTLTPHVITRPEITEENLRSFLLGSESPPLLFEVPAVPPVATAKPTEAPKIEPIRPPTPTPMPGGLVREP